MHMQDRHDRRPFYSRLVPKRQAPTLLAMAALLGFAVVFVLAGSDGWGPAAANESQIGEISRWCERVSGGLLREPVNTLGNLGFVLAGLAMLIVLGRDRLERLNRFHGHTTVSVLYAASVVFLGPGSMLMHGTHTRAGAWIDNVSMVAFILVPWLFNLSVLGHWGDRAFLAAYATLLMTYAAGYWFLGPDLGIGLDFFGLSIGLWVVSETLYRFMGAPLVRVWAGLVGLVVATAFGVTPEVIVDQFDIYWWVSLFWLPSLLVRYPPPGRRRFIPWFWLGMGSFFLAYMIWLTGTADSPTCRPDSIFQPHAVWHVLSAVATFCFFLYFRTERSEGA